MLNVPLKLAKQTRHRLFKASSKLHLIFISKKELTGENSVTDEKQENTFAERPKMSPSMIPDQPLGKQILGIIEENLITEEQTTPAPPAKMNPALGPPNKSIKEIYRIIVKHFNCLCHFQVLT
ncbi:hypothetical protein CEXT_38391 [Caerostris extrusa]|uniref:Uncharacterized protein n=1 Tax=Caerostris extrusa TaxID=172846 RepID=A0AAV4TY13_CAEEX|nr:hypothetical protein CEXT_38391 [Caerostris extrusa]